MSETTMCVCGHHGGSHAGTRGYCCAATGDGPKSVTGQCSCRAFTPTPVAAPQAATEDRLIPRDDLVEAVADEIADALAAEAAGERQTRARVSDRARAVVGPTVRAVRALATPERIAAVRAGALGLQAAGLDLLGDTSRTLTWLADDLARLAGRTREGA